MMQMIHLLHLCSPALPIGAYAYSQGLEYSIDSGWLRTPEEITDWLHGLMQHTLSYTDLPLLRRLFAAWCAQDAEAINYWNNYLRACRESRELLLEDEQLGTALARLLKGLGLTQTITLQMPPTYACQFARAGVHWGIEVDKLCEGFIWAWLENQVAAATKLVPLGQTQGQQILAHLMPHLPALCQAAAARSDDELGRGLPGLALASSLHEGQYSRLFRS
jgi:urease accessory protein